MGRLGRVFAAILTVASLCSTSYAGPVGERHLQTSNPTASLRDAEHRNAVRITVWYPAGFAAKEQSLDIGDPGNPLFRVGKAAPDAPFADSKLRPVVLFSHGFGGSARMMAWFTTALARAGYVVVAVDHPGNNSADKMTAPGAILFWDRAGDLAAALERVSSDPIVGPHLDLHRIAVAGFSAGGFTSLISAGAKVDLNRFRTFCRDNPSDGVCRPQPEFPLTLDETEEALKSPELAAEARHAGDDHAILGVRAVFAMAPAIVQALPPEGMARIDLPVAIILGDADDVATPRTNGLVVDKAIPFARLKVLPGVGHYDFLSTCTSVGMATVPICTAKVPQDQTHKSTIDFALEFFGKVLGKP
jgi:predicted dienelactone hydrolase